MTEENYQLATEIKKQIRECRNKNCYYYGDECVEKQGYDSEPCDDKEVRE